MTLKECTQHPSFNGLEGTVIGRAVDGRWHIALTGAAHGHHVKYVKAMNIEVIEGTADDPIVVASASSSAAAPVAMLVQTPSQEERAAHSERLSLLQMCSSCATSRLHDMLFACSYTMS